MAEVLLEQPQLNPVPVCVMLTIITYQSRTFFFSLIVLHMGNSKIFCASLKKIRGEIYLEK